MRILVTGAAGFIGFHVSLGLLGRGHAVWGVDDLCRGSADRVKALIRRGAGFSRLDVRDVDGLRRAFGEFSPDAVIHLAALTGVSESFEKRGLYMDVNVNGTASIVSVANQFGVPRIAFASSAAVYGEPIKLPIPEEHPLNPTSPYGLSKAEAERIVLREFHGKRGSIALRIFNVYGPGQNPEYAGVISRFIERVGNGESPVIYGDGEQTRDLIYVVDVAEACIRACEVDVDSSEVVNIGSGKPVKIRELADLVIRLMEARLQPIYAEERAGDIKHSYADISKAAQILQWIPKVALREGLRRVIRTKGLRRRA